KRLEKLAATDALTGCLNRRALSEELEAELDRARRYNLALTILLADIDRFKLVNDTRGHLAGDSVLRQVGEILRREARSVDLVARRTKGATWGVNERTTLSQVRDRVRRQRPVLPPRRQHARGGAGQGRDAAARARPLVAGRHRRPYAPAGEARARSRLLPPGRGARLALPGPEKAGRRGHVVRLPRPCGGVWVRSGDTGAIRHAC